MAKLSVIVPIRDPDPVALSNTISSVARQTVASVDMIVVGYSGDPRVAQLLARMSSIRWINEADAGVYDAMNKGVQVSEGEYVLFLGSGDCLVSPEIAEEMLKAGDGGHFIYGKVFDEELGLVGRRFTKWTLCRTNVPHQAIFYSRALFERLGLYDVRFPILADYEFNLRCFGAAWVRRVFVDRIVAVCAGGGLSKRERDVSFERSKEKLIKERLGLHYAVAYGVARRIKAIGRQIVAGVVFGKRRQVRRYRLTGGGGS